MQVTRRDEEHIVKTELTIDITGRREATKDNQTPGGKMPIKETWTSLVSVQLRQQTERHGIRSPTTIQATHMKGDSLRRRRTRWNMCAEKHVMACDRSHLICCDVTPEVSSCHLSPRVQVLRGVSVSVLDQQCPLMTGYDISSR